MALSPFYTYRQMNIIGCPPIADAAVLGSMLSLGRSSQMWRLCADTVMRVNIQEICCRADNKWITVVALQGASWPIESWEGALNPWYFDSAMWSSGLLFESTAKMSLSSQCGLTRIGARHRAMAPVLRVVCSWGCRVSIAARQSVSMIVHVWCDNAVCHHLVGVARDQ